MSENYVNNINITIKDFNGDKDYSLFVIGDIINMIDVNNKIVFQLKLVGENHLELVTRLEVEKEKQ